MKTSIFKTVTLCFIFTLCIFITTSCSGQYKPTDLKAYSIPKSEYIKISSEETPNLSKFFIEKYLLFSGDDIDSFDYQKSLVKMKKSFFEKRLKVFSQVEGGSSVLRLDSGDMVCFVLKGKLLYYAAAKASLLKTAAPFQPQIEDINSEMFSLTFNTKFSKKEDPRKKELLYNYLRSTGKLMTLFATSTESTNSTSTSSVTSKPIIVTPEQPPTDSTETNSTISNNNISEINSSENSPENSSPDNNLDE